MAWITSDDALRALADYLSKDVADLDPRFARFAAIAVPLAQADLTSALNKLGLPAGLLDSWDDRVAFLTSQSLWRIGTLAAGLGGYDLDGLKTFDMRPTLKEGIALSIDGEPYAPSSGDSPLGITFGNTVGGQALDDAFTQTGLAPWDRRGWPV